MAAGAYGVNRDEAAGYFDPSLELDLSSRNVGFGAGEGNRTLVVSLEGFCSTIELHPLAPGSG